jgi:hypothetical protein
MGANGINFCNNHAVCPELVRHIIFMKGMASRAPVSSANPRNAYRVSMSCHTLNGVKNN